jgi:hypothetical protein
LPSATLTSGSTVISRTAYQVGPRGTVNWAVIVVLIGLALMAGAGLTKLRLIRLPSWINYPHPLVVFGGLSITLIGNLATWPVKPYGRGVTMPAIQSAIGLPLIRVGFLVGLIACLSEWPATSRHLGGKYWVLRIICAGLLLLVALFIGIGIIAIVTSSSNQVGPNANPSGPRGALLVLLSGLLLVAFVPLYRASRRQLARRVSQPDGQEKVGDI